MKYLTILILLLLVCVHNISSKEPAIPSPEKIDFIKIDNNSENIIEVKDKGDIKQIVYYLTVTVKAVKYDFECDDPFLIEFVGKDKKILKILCCYGGWEFISPFSPVRYTFTERTQANLYFKKRFFNPQSEDYYKKKPNWNFISVEEFKKIFQNAKDGNSTDQCFVANAYLKGKDGWVEQDCSKALYWYKKAAEQGNSEGQFYLAKIYWLGIATDKAPGIPTDEAAKKWYRKSIDNNFELAIDAGAKLYEEGYHSIIPKNPQEAIRLYLKLGMSKNAKDALPKKIGDIYFEGLLGQKKDYLQAIFWYKKCLKNNKDEAILLKRLGQIYKSGGYGVQRNLSKATFYFEKYRKILPEEKQDATEAGKTGGS